MFVAIPVVVDLLLRQETKPKAGRPILSRNPCCSGPTPSTALQGSTRIDRVESQSLL